MCVTMSPGFSSARIAGSGDTVWPTCSITGRPKGSTAARARRTASRSFLPTTVSVRRAFTPTITSRCRSIALRAASTSALAMSISSVPDPRPTFDRFSRMRTRLGAALAIATTSSILSAPCEPASTATSRPATARCPACRACARACARRSSPARPACRWRRWSPSRPPGATPTPTAAMRPFAIATSAMRSKPRDGSITRPPRISTSCGAANACLLLANDAAPNRRRPHEVPSREHVLVGRWSLVVSR